MAPQSKTSKRLRFGKWVRNIVQPGGDRVEDPGPTSRDSGSSATLSTSAQPAPSAPPTKPREETATKVHPIPTPRATEQITTSSAAAGPGPTDDSKPTAAENTAWSALKISLQALETGSDAFPPLKSVVAGFIACLDIVQTSAANRKDYRELADRVKRVSDSLGQYLSELVSEEQSPSIIYLLSSINVQIMQINKTGNRAKPEELLEVAQDEKDVIDCYRKVGSLFLQLQYNVTLQTWANTDEQVAGSLLRATSYVDDARYNSSYSTIIERHGCMKETREKVQADLQHWVRDPNGAKVYWMTGMAGTGKTTIAYSLCEWLEANKQLGASFFSSHASNSCSDANRVAPTIAYQLARYSPAFRSSLCKRLEASPDISKLDITQQFQKLIQEPLQEVKNAMPRGVVVVVDGLDECERNEDVGLLLQTLLQLAGGLPLKFFITSWPENAIAARTESPNGYPPSVLHLHNIGTSPVEEDIKKYLTEALSFMTPPGSDTQIAHVAKRAGTLFIYVATVVRFIRATSVLVDSNNRLQTILQMDSKPTSTNESNKGYTELDLLYSMILDKVFGQSLEQKDIEVGWAVLWTIICVKEPLTTPTIAALLDLTENQVSLTVQSLRPVLHLSDAGLVSTLHTSFLDYMLGRQLRIDFHPDLSQPNQSQSNNSHRDYSNQHQLLAGRCFQVMKQQLRFNICELESSAMYDEDIPDLAQKIEKFISPALLYACRHWSDHLRLAVFSDDLRIQLDDFLSQRLLFWMEVINFRPQQHSGTPTQILERAESSSSIDTRKLLVDAQEFATSFFSYACSKSTPHIYISALPFHRQTSAIYALYWERTRGLISVRGTITMAREKRNSPVNSVAFSPDGTRIVSGSEDKTIQVRNSYNGDTVFGPFEGHTAAVRSVAFSPDGTLIGSGSSDCTVRIWDAHTGSAITGPFTGHSGPISSVVFSPDGSRIVSGSWDKTIRVWNVHTDAPTECSCTTIPDSEPCQSCEGISKPLEGHTSPVNSVAFSPDSTYIASGSGYYTSSGPTDCNVRVWNARTGKVVAGPFKGHKGPVSSVAFSPDSAHIVSGSWDSTIRVWDIATGNAIVGPLEGNAIRINSVAFSPDGTRIVSGIGTNTFRDLVSCAVQVWDANTGGRIAEKFLGHTALVNSVAFSSDGTRIVSGSGDYTIRVWAAPTSKSIPSPPSGHTSPTSSLSPPTKGTPLAPGSELLGLSGRKIHTSGHHYRAIPLDDSLASTWSFRPDGWVTINGAPAFWVMPHLQNYISYPGETLAIGNRGALEIGYSDLAFGSRWSECYVP